MTNEEYLKSKISNMINKYTRDELYELLTGENPFQQGICNLCTETFGECPENIDGDELCKKKFRMWCKMKRGER